MTSLTASLTAVRNTLRDMTERREAVVVPFQEKLELIHGLCKRLGTEVGAEYLDVGSRLDNERLGELDGRIRVLSLEEKNRRNAIGREARIIRDFIERLGAAWETELDRAIENGSLESMDPEQSLIDALSSRAQQLQQMMADREKEIKGVCRDIAVLWDTMGVESAEQEDFLSKHHGVSDKVLESCKAERNRLGELKKQMVGPLILRTRERISKLWGQLHTPADEREAFAAFRAETGDFTEECLLLHEQAEARLRAEYTELSPILKEIAKRERVLAERAKFEKEQQDSSRLVARGRGAAARLKYEEKLRSRIKVEFIDHPS